MLESKAVIFKGKGEVVTGSVVLDDSNLGPRDMLLETLVSLVSTGTELRVLLHGFKGTEYPLVPGYSAVCRIVRKGDGASGYNVGDLVFAAGGNRISSGASSLWGSHCRFQIVSCDEGIYRLSGKLSPEEYAFTKVVAIALHGVRMAGIEPSERIVVMGLGLIGSFSLRCLLARGAEIIACDTSNERLAVAKKLGVTTINPMQEDLKTAVYGRWPRGADAVFEVTARTSVIRTAASLLAVRSYSGDEKPPRLVLQANYVEDIVFGNRDLFEREAVVVSPRDVQPGDFEAAARMLESGVVNVKDLLPGTESPDQASVAYRRLVEHPEKSFTALFDWRKLPS